MSAHAWIALATLVAATTLFITRWVPLALTALAIPVVLYATGVLPDVNDALMGFGNHAVLAIGAVMILGGALNESGVATLMARGIQRVGGTSELGLLLLFMVSTAGLAAFMNNTAVVAILLPVAAALSRRSGVAATRLFMPMAFAAVLGGTISLIGTAPNFLAADFYNNSPAGQTHPIGVFDYAAVGIPITLAGIAYMALVGRHLLPDRASAGAASDERSAQRAARDYGLQSKLFEMRVAASSPLVGKTLGSARVRTRFGLGIVAVHRPSSLGSRWFQPKASLAIEAGDHLYLVGEEEAAWTFAESELLQFGLADHTTIERLLERGTSIAEVSPSPHSGLIGRTIREIEFQKRYELGVIGYWRRNEAVQGELGDVALRLGDAFLVAGRPRQIHALASNPDFVVLTDPSHREDVGRAPLAIAVLLLALVPPVFFDFPLAVSALGAACLMVLTGCLARRHVAKTVDWSVLALIAGTLPLGRALQQQGLSDQVAGLLAGVSGGATAIYGLLFLLAATFSVLTSNAAAAVIVAPVAAATAVQGGLDPRSALLAMAYGCSCNFLLPFAQCNLLVMTPGGYQTRDYVRVGLGMSVVMAVTCIACLALMG